MLTSKTKSNRFALLAAGAVGLVALEFGAHYLGMIIPWRSLALWVCVALAFVGLCALVKWAEQSGLFDTEFASTTPSEVAREEAEERAQREARQERHRG